MVVQLLDASISYQRNEFEKDVCKMAVPLCRLKEDEVFQGADDDYRHFAYLQNYFPSTHITPVSYVLTFHVCSFKTPFIINKVPSVLKHKANKSK